LKATIIIEYDDAKVAKAVEAAVSPDNLKTPADMTVKTVLNRNTVTTEIDAEGKIATFIATIDDLLFCISVAEKALKTMRDG